MRPPPRVLSLPDSSNRMISNPPFLKVELAISGPMRFFSQLSAVVREQLWASLQIFGVMNEYCGSVLFARSVANWLNGTRFLRCTELFTTSEKNDNGQCRRT